MFLVCALVCVGVSLMFAVVFVCISVSRHASVRFHISNSIYLCTRSMIPHGQHNSDTSFIFASFLPLGLTTYKHMLKER